MKFGDLASPCGPGTAKGATDQGVTDTGITIAYGADEGFAGFPGLQHEMSNAVKAMIKWCNDQGGILGRPINGIFKDAALTQVTSRMMEACTQAFMLVGEGWGADEAAESIRLGCNLVAVPGFSVGPDFANAPEMFQAVPNPDDVLEISSAYEAAQLFPDAISKAAILHTTLDATETSSAKVEQAYTSAGFKFLDCGVKVNNNGEPDYTPFVQKLQSCGARLIFLNISPGPPLFNLLTAIDQLNYHPIILGETNIYSTAMSQWNTKGLGDNVYVRDVFQPIENATTVPAVLQYSNAVRASGGDLSQLGEQAASSFLLWATEAKACQSNLTRQCMINNLAKVHDWTGGGLHASADPGANLPPSCGVLLKLTGTSWGQFYPKAAGQFDCNPKYRATISGAATGADLGPDRIATRFLGGSLIKPQP